MSAFLLVSANALYRATERKRQGKHRAKSSSNESILSSGRVSSYSRGKGVHELASIDSSTSTASSTSTGTKTNRKQSHKIYDVNKNTYVDRNTLILPCDRAVIHFEHKLENLSNFHYSTLNLILNAHCVRDPVDNSSHFLFGKHNLEILMYIYFQDFTIDQAFISTQIATNNKQTKPTIHFMRKRQQIHSQSKKHKVIKGLPSLDVNETALGEVEEETSEDYSMLSGSLPINTASSDTLSEGDTFSDIYGEYLQPLSPNTDEHQASIRQLFRSKQLWNNVYQDMKLEYPHQYEYLPSVLRIQNFYLEVIDYFLYNICTLDIKITPELVKNMKELASYEYFYFNDQHYEWFKVMSKLHQKIFRFPHFIDTTGNLPEIDIADALVSIISLNVKLALQPHGIPGLQRERYDKVLNLWSGCVNFIISEIIVKRENYNSADGMAGADKISCVSDPISEVVEQSLSLYNTDATNETFAQNPQETFSPAKADDLSSKETTPLRIKFTKQPLPTSFAKEEGPLKIKFKKPDLTNPTETLPNIKSRPRHADIKDVASPPDMAPQAEQPRNKFFRAFHRSRPSLAKAVQ